MSLETLASIVTAFAPTVASKIMPLLQAKKYNQEELTLIMISLTAEANNNITELLTLFKEYNSESKEIMGSIKSCVDGNALQIQEISEAAGTILKRTSNVRVRGS